MADSSHPNNDDLNSGASGTSEHNGPANGVDPRLNVIETQPDDDETYDEAAEAAGGYFEFTNPNLAAIMAEEEQADYSTLTGAEEGAARLPSLAEGGEDDVAAQEGHAGTAMPQQSGETFGLPAAAVAVQASETIVVNEAGTTVEIEESETVIALTQAQVEDLIAMRLRQLDREYAETSGSRGGGAGATPSPSASGAAAGDERLANLRRAMAAARAARAGNAATMQLAPGADEFPDDYDAMQERDASALRGQPAAPTMASFAVADGFDPFTGPLPASAPAAAATGAASTALSAASGLAPAPAAASSTLPPARPVSPLASETKAAIQDAMSRIKITPKGRVPAWADRVVATALQHGQASIAAHRTAAASSDGKAK